MKRETITVTTFSRKERMKKRIVPMAAGIITAVSIYALPVHASGVSEVLNPINNLKTLVLSIISGRNRPGKERDGVCTGVPAAGFLVHELRP